MFARQINTKITVLNRNNVEDSKKAGENVHMLAIKPESTLINRLGTLLLDSNSIYKTSDAIAKRDIDRMEYVDDGIGGESLRNLYDSRRTVHVGAEIRQLMRAVTKGIFLISEQYNEMSQIEKNLKQFTSDCRW